MAEAPIPTSFLESPDAALLRGEWQSLQNGISDALRASLAAMVVEQAPLLVSCFYDVLEADADARSFLSQDLIRNKLQTALAVWLHDLFPENAAPDFDRMAARQISVGEIHSRINLPLKLVNRGLRLMNDELMTAIVEKSPPQALATLLSHASSVLGMAVEIMNTAYARESSRAERNEEAYRLFSLGQNLAQEREAQRAALAEWLQYVLFDIASGNASAGLPCLEASEFGMWLTHRGSVVFDGMPGLERVHKLIADIDDAILPQLKAEQNNAQELARLQSHVNEIKLLIGACFNAATRFENGQDPLTQTFNRRFMDTILSREVGYARKKKQSLSVAMIDLDHFKAINDRIGHPAGDTVLQKCAEVILNLVRIGDFVFRYGGEEFLIALVETSEQNAFSLAERVRRAIAETEIMLPDGTFVQVTASIGVAGFKGDPDYRKLIEAADKALYRAKADGRDRVALAEEMFA